LGNAPIENGEKALVFSQYPNATLKKIMLKLKQFTPLLYEGSLSEQDRNRYIAQFQNENTHKVLLMSVKSGGTGITLTRANHVFHFDIGGIQL
jgi:SNF2 family DNA or RNA helicase